MRGKDLITVGRLGGEARPAAREGIEATDRNYTYTCDFSR